MLNKISILFSAATVVLVFACTPKVAKTTTTTEPTELPANVVLTYNGTAGEIIKSYCAGCHKKFNTYEGLKTVLDNGEFKEEVIIKKRMPKFKSLTAQEYNTLKAWVEKGSPQ